MVFPETELGKIRKKTLLKTDLIGQTPRQYILYRINLSSEQHIEESSLKFSVDEIEMVEPKPGEHCQAVAVVKIRPADGVIWEGEVAYRIPQIEINRYYGDVFTLALEDIRDFLSYNDLAKSVMLPPKTFKTSEFIGLGDGALSYRLNFNNPFFEGSLRVDVTGISNLITDKPLVDRLLGIQQTTQPLSSAFNTKVLSGLNVPAL